MLRLVEAPIRLRTMQNLGDADLVTCDEVEDSIVAHPQAVQGWVVMAPEEANVGTRTRTEGILPECA